MVDLICSLEAVLHTDTDSKAVKVTYLSSIYSFGCRAALTILDYILEEIKACTENTIYIIRTVIPTLCVVLARKIVSLIYQSTQVQSSQPLILETPCVVRHHTERFHPAVQGPSTALPLPPENLSIDFIYGHQHSHSHSHRIDGGNSRSHEYGDDNSDNNHERNRNENANKNKNKNDNNDRTKNDSVERIKKKTSFFIESNTSFTAETTNINNQSQSKPQSMSPLEKFSILTDFETEVLQKIRDKYRELLSTYAQSMKISLSVTITSFFLLLPALRQIYPNSFWAILVVILIRQDNTSSSFLTGYQRLEGTVIGAVYSFTMYTIFGCGKSKCGIDISTPVLVIWLAFCAFFRDGPRHGYAAIVAGFTPIVLFLGNTPSTAAGAWQRVEETWIGVGIYLIIDNLILPNRTADALREDVLVCVTETR